MATPKGHRPQLDALRTIAVVMVAVYHSHHPSIAGHELPLGFLGVGLFFVLSGYLITTILLTVQTRLETSSSTAWQAVRAFYARRFLRLVPAYYFYLLVVWVTGLATDPGGLVWYLLYAGNFRSADVGWHGEVAHLWSLAVEEQFYLVAPLAILLVARRHRQLTTVVVLTVMVVGLFASPSESILPPGAFVGLLIGCVLAAMANGNTTVNKRVVADLIGRAWIPMAIAWGLVFWFVGPDTTETRTWHAIYRLTAYISMAGLVWVCAVGISGPARALLEWHPILWLGKISYGLYLWHNIAPYVTSQLWPEIMAQPTAVRFTLFSVCTLAMASLSWFVVERPFLDAKDRFPYIRPTSEATDQVAERARA